MSSEKIIDKYIIICYYINRKENYVMKVFARFVLYTLLWCLFPPLFFFYNRGTKLNDPRDAFLSPKAGRKALKALKRGKILTALELFWSKFNPGITTETTQPLYAFCGGNRKPVFSTLMVFLYSGIFLHWLGIGLMWRLLYHLFKGEPMWILTNLLASGWVIISIYVSMGLCVATKKWLRQRQSKRKQGPSSA